MNKTTMLVAGGVLAALATAAAVTFTAQEAEAESAVVTVYKSPT